MENTASDLAVEELRKQQRALKEYSYRQEEFDKEMSVHKLVEKLKQKLSSINSPLTAARFLPARCTLFAVCAERPPRSFVSAVRSHSHSGAQ